MKPAAKTRERTALPSKNVTVERRYQMIRDAAYYRAERRGFEGGDPMRDWLDAEAEIDSMLSSATGH